MSFLSRICFERSAIPSPTVSAKESACRMARLRHWLEMRARRVSPNVQSLGELLPSRLTQDGGKLWRRCNSTVLAFIVGPLVGWFGWIQLDGQGHTRSHAPSECGCWSDTLRSG